MIAVVATLRNKEDAARIGRGLLEQRLIAGYNLWPVDSGYWREGEIAEAHEIMMLMKTTLRWFDDIAEYIKARSGYEVPQVIAMDVEKIELSHQKWLNDEIK